MKKLSCYIGLLMATLWLAACKSDTPLEPETTVGDGEQVLEITVDGDFYASSRSTAASAGYKLASSQAIQHIEHLYAYIFDGSGTDATCVYVTEIPWEQNSQQGSASLTYRLKEANLPQYVTDGKPSDMQVLVVAVDNNTDTYNFPYGEVANHADNTNQEGNNSIIGQQLSGVKLKLAEAAAGTTTSDADKAFKMANTEVFSGLASFKADDQIIKVSLQRCVAGILCYLTDIPYYVGTGTEENNKISSIELQLGNGLNLNTEYDSFYDGTKFGSEASSNNVIASVNILEYIYGKGTTSGTLDVQPEDASLTDKNTQRLYVPAMDNGVVKTKENTILFGAYLLPIKNTVTDDNTTDDNTTNATLKLVLKANNEVQQTAFIVKNTVTSVPGEPDASGNPTTITELAYAYSLKANRLYSIGSKPFATDTDADQPASLKGKEIELNVLGWSNGNENGANDVNFPVYSLKSTISADWNTQYENYIFNCMSETRTVYINLSEEDAKDSDFRISILDEDGSSLSDWAYFRFVEFDADGNSPALTDWETSAIIPDGLKGRSRIALEIRLNDYVLKNDIIGDDSKYSTIETKIDALKKDFRTAYLHLFSNGITSVASVPIRQFNAITYGNLGYARLDYGATMGDNGKGGYGSLVDWGLKGLFGYEFWKNWSMEKNEQSGYFNYTNLDTSQEKVYTSVIYLTHKEKVFGKDETNIAYFWFLPAMNEIQPFIEKVISLELCDVLNLKKEENYWTSTIDYWNRDDNSCAILCNDKALVNRISRNNKCYCRQAMQFN